MTEAQFRFDEVGAWSVLKLEILEKYGRAYVRAFANARGIKKYYIDGFSGAGVHIVKGTREKIDGSPVRALKISPPFDGFHFIDMNPDKAAHLERLREGREDVHIYTGDANSILKTLLPTIRYDNYERALCLLDPYGLHLDWEVVALAGRSKVVDMFLNFPIMDINRNAIWSKPDRVPKDGIERMNPFWGDESWRQLSYTESPQQNLFSEPDLVKQPNDAIVTAFLERLRKVAGFAHVAEPLPMKNANNATVYYLIFASTKFVAGKIIDSIFKKYR